MKNYRLLTIIFVILFLSGGAYHYRRESRAKVEDTASEVEALHVVLPEAQSFKKETSEAFPYFKGYRTSAQTDADLIGFAFLTTDVAPEVVGYAGPIEMLVGMTPRGTVTKVHVLQHSETSSYMFRLDNFIGQFASKGLDDAFELGVDVDGISRATITSTAVTRAVGKSLKEAGRRILQVEAAALSSQDKQLPWNEIFVPLVLFTLAAAGAVSHRRDLRRFALAGGFLYFGILKATMISSVQFANICLMKFPPFAELPLWYMLVGLTLLSTLLFGMLFCGSLCPFAAVEETLYRLVHRKRQAPVRTLSRPIDQNARYAKYAVLFTVIGVSVYLGNSDAASIEPFLTLFTGNGTALAWTLLGLMLMLSFFHFRFWCKYLCPVGACLGLLAQFSLWKIKLDTNCSHCNACEKICPTRAIRIAEPDLPVIDHPECILCGECVSVCPREKDKPKPSEAS